MNEIAIEIKDVSKSFKGQTKKALDEISVTFQYGVITGLVGPDAAGKTTLIRLITGLMLPSEGTVCVCGYDTKKEGQKIQNILGYMPQKFGLYEDLTVMENLELYADLRNLIDNEKKEVFTQMLNFTDLKNFTKRRAGQLSGGMKQKLGLACALLSRPKILLLDEPSVGVDPISRRELWQMVKELVKEKMAVIWSTSYLDEAALCKEVLLLNEGKLLFNGLPQKLTEKVNDRVFHIQTTEEKKREMLTQILQQKGVIDAIIQGSSIRVLTENKETTILDYPLKPIAPRFEDAFMDLLKGNYARQSMLAEKMIPKPKSKEGPPPIETEKLTKKFGDFVAAKEMTFKVERGEIFGLLGPNGAGKSTTFKMLCGLLQPTSGKALVSGIDLKISSSQARTKIGYMAQKFSLYGDLSVKQNLDFFAGVYGLRRKKRREITHQMIETFHFKKYLNVNSGILPLGYKQRLALACAIMHTPDVLFLDEPTSGVDPLTRREFWTHINGMVKKGITIMVTTHFMEEAEYCDRIALIYRAKNIATDSPDGLKAQVRSKELPDPTLEDAFIELIKRHEDDD